GLPDDVLSTASPAEILKSIQNKFAEYDAATLARKWFRKVTIPGVGVAYLPSDAKRPENEVSQTVDGPPIQWGAEGIDKCDEPKWTAARCTRALEKLATWEIDF